MEKYFSILLSFGNLSGVISELRVRLDWDRECHIFMHIEISNGKLLRSNRVISSEPGLSQQASTASQIFVFIPITAQSVSLVESSSLVSYFCNSNSTQ